MQLKTADQMLLPPIPTAAAKDNSKAAGRL